MFFSGKAALRGELENFNTSLFEQIKKVLFKTDQGKKIRLSFSIGYAAAGYPPEWRKTLKEAENAMFRAKGKSERAFLFS
jgi:GGDEF domain-containing protein